MVDAANLSYQFNGKLADLRNGVIKSCIQMSLVIKDEVNYPDKFTIKASQKTNWLSTNWPIKIVITAERIGQSYVLLIRGDSSMGSLTQSSNNSAKVHELLTLIKVYAPSQSQQAQNDYIEENALNNFPDSSISVSGETQFYNKWWFWVICFMGFIMVVGK